MKRFAFTLEKATAWRRLQRDQELASLEKFYAERAHFDRQREELIQERVATDRSIAHSPQIDALSIEALPQWQKHTVASLRAISDQKGQLEVRIGQQQIKVRDAERQVRLLERVRLRRFTAWQADLLKEEETFAAEAFLAKCIREKNDPE